MVYIDTNIILRYLLKDDEKQYVEACKIVDNNDIFILDLVIVEVCYVLKSVYKIDKEIIYTLVMELLSMDNIIFSSRALIYETFKLYMKENLDIVDCILIAYHSCEGREVATFDKIIQKNLAE